MNALLAALINGGLLSAVAAALLWTALRIAPRRVLNAATRYAAWWAALLITAIFPALFLAGNSRRIPASPPTVSMPAPAPLPRIPDSPDEAGHAGPVASVEPEMPAPLETGVLAAEPPRRSAAPRFPIEITAGGWTRWIAIIWLVAAAVTLIRLAISWLSLYRAVARASEPPAHLMRIADEWLARCGSRRRGVRLVLSSEVGVPAAVGPVGPVILFPARLLKEMDARALEQIGLHEAAHLARRDDYALCVQRVLEALLVLHPVARWIARRIDLEREIACDDFVLALTGQTRGYAWSLSRMAELSSGRRPSPMVAAAVGRSQLTRRIETLLDRTRHRGTRLLRAWVAGVTALLIAFAWTGERSPGLLAFASPPGSPSVSSRASALLLKARRLPQLAADALAQIQIVTTPDGRPNIPSPQAPAAPVRPEDQCTLEGSVTNASTGEPIGKATIYIRSQAGMRSTYQTVTDETGRFEAKGVNPGQYQVFASHSRFVSSLYWEAAQKTMTLGAAEKASGINLTMMPDGVISGRVVNRNGDPMASYYVTPLVYRYVGGRRVLTEAQGSPISNDAGEYRMHGLPPGRYYIQVARETSRGARYAEVDRSARPRAEDYVTSYYPGTADPASAAPIDLAAGQTVNGIDITVAKSRVTRVSGRVANQTGMAARTSWLALTSADGAGVWGANANVSPEDDFEFQGVAPGRYWLDARSLLQNGRWRYGRQAITVGEEPLDNLIVPVTAGYEISGAVRVEGDAKLDLRSLKIGLRMPWRQVYGFTVNPAPVDGNGAFRLSEINPERYVLEIQNLPENFYVKAARVGDLDALENGIDLTRGAPGPLQIVLSGAASSVTGSVKDSGGAPVAEATVALVPQEPARQKQPVFYRSSKTDASGAFKLTGLMPGQYKAYAWKRVEGEPWVSADFLAPFEGEARSVTLREGSSQNVELRVIPAER